MDTTAHRPSVITSHGVQVTLATPTTVTMTTPERAHEESHPYTEDEVRKIARATPGALYTTRLVYAARAAVSLIEAARTASELEAAAPQPRSQTVLTAAEGVYVETAPSGRIDYGGRQHTWEAMQRRGFRYSELMAHLADLDAGHTLTAEDGTTFRRAN